MYKLLLACIVVVMLVAFASYYPSFSQSSPNMSFFITSAGSGNGANLGGLAGADAICQRLAASVGAGNKTWRAYLSTSAVGGQPAVNARDRIGRGPWQNAKGVAVAQNVDDLHSNNNKLGKENSLTEKGGTVGPHDMLTGSGTDGRALSGDKTCTIGPAARTAPLAWAITTSKAEGRIQTPGILLTIRAAAVRPIWFPPVVRARSIALPNESCAFTVTSYFCSPTLSRAFGRRAVLYANRASESRCLRFHGESRRSGWAD